MGVWEGGTLLMPHPQVKGTLMFMCTIVLFSLCSLSTVSTCDSFWCPHRGYFPSASLYWLCIGTTSNSIPRLYCLYSTSVSEQASLPSLLVFQRDLSRVPLFMLPTTSTIQFFWFLHCAPGIINSPCLYRDAVYSTRLSPRGTHSLSNFHVSTFISMQLWFWPSTDQCV